MASLKKRGNYWSIVFKKHINGKPVRKTYALGTRYKKIAEHKQTEYEKLYQSGEIDPFDDNWNLKEFEESQKSNNQSSTADNYYLEDLKEDFLEYKSHLTSASLKAYKSVIKLFIEHVGRSMTATLIQPSDIRTFCLQNTYSNATQRNYLRHLKVFFNWLTEKEIIEKNPCSDITPPKKKDKLVDKVFDVKTLNKILNTFRKYQHKHKKAGAIQHHTQMQFWFKPLVTTAFYTGLRRKELVQLKWSHVHLEKRELQVTDTKNGRERTVILFDPAYERLKAWKKFTGDPKHGLVFPSPRSTSKLEIPLGGDNASKAFKKMVTEAKLKESIHFHCLRHSCATYMIRKGFDVTMVKDMLGHKSIEVTMRYVHLVSNDSKNKAEKLGLITSYNE